MQDFELIRNSKKVYDYCFICEFLRNLGSPVLKPLYASIDKNLKTGTIFKYNKC